MGRLPATRIAAVLTLQALHDYAGRETAEAVRFAVRWKAAIGSSLEDAVRPVVAGELAEPDRQVGPTAPGQRPGHRGDRCAEGRRRRAVGSAVLNLRNLTGWGLARQGGAWTLVT